MKTRIITGVFVALMLIALVLFANLTLASVIVFIASAIGIFEFYKMTDLTKNDPLVLLGLCGAVLIFFGNIYFSWTFSLFVYVWLVFSFVTFLIFHENFEVTDFTLMIFSVFYIPYLFSFVPLTLGLENGRMIIWFALIGAFVTDTFAYFTGVFLGKHKLCPKISPKKTIEGSIGGTLGSALIFVLFGYLFNTYFKADFSYLHLILCGIISAIVAQTGDLFASILKRKYSVKDYGSLFPGHGGILDRFDSLLFVTPVIYFLFNI